MRYLLIEPKTKAIAPNIALLKYARWCERNDHEYQYVRGKIQPKITPEVILISCVFSYYADEYQKTIDHYIKRFPDSRFIVGGAFPSLNPKWFKRWSNVEVHKGLSKNIESLTPKYNVEITSEDDLPYPRDKIVLYTSRGCTNRCQFCCIPKLEGKLKSFKSIINQLEAAREEMPHASGVFLYDNNFTNHKYFDRIVDELKDFGLPVDFRQGLHVESFTKHKAERLAELQWAGQRDNSTPYIRFSFDKLKYAKGIERALRYVIEKDVKASFFCYLLYNWTGTPKQFWKKIEICQDIVDRIGESIFLFPQRYEPLKALKRNQFVGKHWTPELVRGLTRLYTHIHGFIPITRSRNVYNWIGHDFDEFIERVGKMATNNHKLKKTDRMQQIVDNSAMEFHEVAGIFPMMGLQEFEELKSDIEANGLLEPIWLYQNRIIDGRNRYLACQEIGIKPNFRKWKAVKGNGDLLSFVVSLNLKRRHLNSSQKAMSAVDALPYYEKQAKNRQGTRTDLVEKIPESGFGKSRDFAAQAFGVSGRYISAAKRIKKHDSNLAEKVRKGEITLTHAISLMKRGQRLAKFQEATKKYKSSKDIKVVCGDFYQWCHKNLKEDSVDLILTDPPYAKKYLHLYDKLGETAARVLKPSKFLVVYCGSVYLPQILQMLSKHLNWHWLYCLKYKTVGHKHPQRNIMRQWRPVAVFYKYPSRITRTSNEVVQESGREKGLHDWQQTESGVNYFMDLFSNAGDKVLDPMVGSGTVLKVARDLKRKAIGIDIDPKCVELTKGRLART